MLYAKMTNDWQFFYPDHSHNHFEIMYVLDGEGYFSSGTKKWPLTPGTIFIAPPGVGHSTESRNGHRIISIGGNFDKFFFMDDIYVVYDNDFNEGKMLAEAILRNVYSNEDYAQSLCRSYIKFLLIGIKQQPVICSVIYKITSEIERQFDNPDFKVTSLLVASGYSEDYIRMKFQEITKMTPVKYLTSVRMKNAKTLLTLYDYNINEVASRCGILDNTRFSRLFKSYYGISPKQYRDSL